MSGLCWFGGGGRFLVGFFCLLVFLFCFGGFFCGKSTTQRASYQLLFYYFCVTLLAVNLCIGIIMANTSHAVITRSKVVKEIFFHTMWATSHN